MHCHFVVTFLSVTGRDTLDLHSTTILKLMFLWCVMPFQLNHLRSYNCLLNSKVIEIVVLTIHLWICLCTTQGFKADFCWNKKGGCVLLCIRGRYYQRRGKANNHHFFFFREPRGFLRRSLHSCVINHAHECQNGHMMGALSAGVPSEQGNILSWECFHITTL